MFNISSFLEIINVLKTVNVERLRGMFRRYGYEKWRWNM